MTIRPWRLLAKGIAVFLIFEFGFYALHPSLAWLNVYNLPALKRLRFPISTHAPEDNALDVENLDAMFASHIVSQPKAKNEYRVLVLGDSAVWGIGLTPDQTLPGQLDALGLKCGNKDVRVYNLSFPRSSATKDLMILERYSHVMHIVSQVEGNLSGGRTPYDLMRATFPAGTLTGAPKIRAMQIIAELEQTARGPYGGCVGYFSFSGNLDFCITIRTALLKDGQAHVQAGGGWVNDSTPESEFQETVNKAKAMLKAVAMAESFAPPA